jgi:Kef-type K+ transport system membrane component KefB
MEMTTLFYLALILFAGLIFGRLVKFIKLPNVTGYLTVVKKYIGFTLVPQAGVAIGLSLIASQLLPELGQTIRAVVLCATFIYELTGPAITKISLKMAGEISD